MLDVLENAGGNNGINHDDPAKPQLVCRSSEASTVCSKDSGVPILSYSGDRIETVNLGFMNLPVLKKTPGLMRSNNQRPRCLHCLLVLMVIFHCFSLANGIPSQKLANLPENRASEEERIVFIQPPVFRGRFVIFREGSSTNPTCKMFEFISKALYLFKRCSSFQVPVLEDIFFIPVLKCTFLFFCYLNFSSKTCSGVMMFCVFFPKKRHENGGNKNRSPSGVESSQPTTITCSNQGQYLMRTRILEDCHHGWLRLGVAAYQKTGEGSRGH